MKKFFNFIILFLCTIMPVFAENKSAMTEFSIYIPKYLKIESIISPVLTANITNRSGNLHSPLYSKFKVISNSAEPTKLYLKSSVVTDAGLENSMFEQNGQVYIAFANLIHTPSSSSLANCKAGGSSNNSPGIVAYPVISVKGGNNNKFSKDKYELEVTNGITYVDINVGSQVLKNSFGNNDKKGFYQAILSLTEADI